MPLIDLDSPLYHKRMRQAIADVLEHGVYLAAVPYNNRVYAVKVHANVLRVRVFASMDITADSHWYTVQPGEIDQFFDGYGRRICASRQN